MNIKVYIEIFLCLCCDYLILHSKLGVKADSVSEITVTDSKGIVGTFLVKDENTLIIFGGGTYFELVRK